LTGISRLREQTGSCCQHSDVSVQSFSCKRTVLPTLLRHHSIGSCSGISTIEHFRNTEKEKEEVRLERREQENNIKKETEKR
jgi:hypothetical protein